MTQARTGPAQPTQVATVTSRMRKSHNTSTRQTSPTALELLDWARAQGETLFDINSLRPRLTALVEAGHVETAGKRRCRVSGKTVHTWRVCGIGGKGRS